MGRIATGIAAAVLAAGISLPAMAETQWDMPTPYPDNNFHTQNIQQFAADVEKATGGELKIKVHSAGSLFKHPDIKNAVRGGQVPIGEFLLSRLSNENAVYQVDSVPFLATSYDDAEKLWAASKPEIERLLKEQGLQVLFAVPWPPQGLFAKKKIDEVSDMKGLKFRAYNTATSQLAQLAGAVPTQVEVPDIPQAFATGRVAAMITSPSTGANTKAWDFLSHYHDTQAWLPKNVIVVNERSLRDLDGKTLEAVMQAAKAAEERGWKMSREETEEKTKVLADNGITVVEPSAELKKGLQEIGQTMTEEWSKAAGEAGDKILKAYRN